MIPITHVRVIGMHEKMCAIDDSVTLSCLGVFAGQ